MVAIIIISSFLAIFALFVWYIVDSNRKIYLYNKRTGEIHNLGNDRSNECLRFFIRTNGVLLNRDEALHIIETTSARACDNCCRKLL